MIMRSHEVKAFSNRLRSGAKRWNWSRSGNRAIWPGSGKLMRYFCYSGGYLNRRGWPGIRKSVSGIATAAKLAALEAFING